jgi:hypothetical protein
LNVVVFCSRWTMMALRKRYDSVIPTYPRGHASNPPRLWAWQKAMRFFIKLDSCFNNRRRKDPQLQLLTN